MRNREIVFIYGLCDDRDGALRYVGQTVDIMKRHGSHTRHQDKVSRGVAGWIKSGAKPIMILIAASSPASATKIERAAIKRARMRGANLLNKNRPSTAPSGPGSAVVCVETGRKFKSFNAAARAMGCSGSTVSKRCRDGDALFPSMMHFIVSRD